MSQALTSKIHCMLLANQKEIVSSMYNNIYDSIYENHVKTLYQKSHRHFDFTTPKGLKIPQAMIKKNRDRGEKEKEDRRVEEKKTNISFNFHIVYCVHM